MNCTPKYMIIVTFIIRKMLACVAAGDRLKFSSYVKIMRERNVMISMYLCVWNRTVGLLWMHPFAYTLSLTVLNFY